MLGEVGDQSLTITRTVFSRANGIDLKLQCVIDSQATPQLPTQGDELGILIR